MSNFCMCAEENFIYIRYKICYLPVNVKVIYKKTKIIDIDSLRNINYLLVIFPSKHMKYFGECRKKHLFINQLKELILTIWEI